MFQCVYDDVFLVYEFSSSCSLLDYLLKNNTFDLASEKPRFAREVSKTLILSHF